MPQKNNKMKLKTIIRKIFEREELVDKPPVLIDIGASEEVHYKWKDFSEYSICVAFEADERDFQFIEKEDKRFKKLYIFNCVVSEKYNEASNFYLTKSPYCSSILEPIAQDKINSLLFSPLFQVENVKKVKTISLNDALSNLGLTYIDWFKTDSQGTDLRLFNSLNEKIQSNIIAAEFEPGFINLYKNEDMLYSVLKYMNGKKFWLSKFTPKGTPKINNELLYSIAKSNLKFKLIKESLTFAPCWAEISYINNFEPGVNFSLREFLLGWLFSTIEDHHSFALMLTEKARGQYRDDILIELRNYSILKIKSQILKLKFLPSLYKLIRKKIK